jgi:hypothetical protein
MFCNACSMREDGLCAAASPIDPDKLIAAVSQTGTSRADSVRMITPVA